MFEFVDHVAFAVLPGQMEAQIAKYEALGFRVTHREDVLGTDQVREVMLHTGDGPSAVQLLEPLSSESPVAKLIEKNGGRGGFAHLAWRVKDARAVYDAMAATGAQLIDAGPRAGSRGTRVFFVHPKTFGYLLEVVEA